jgi:chemotaxis protein CheX
MNGPGPKYPLSPDDLWGIAEMVWASYLDPVGEHPLMSGPVVQGTDDVAGMVSISGAWEGRVVVTFTPAASRHAAAALLGAGPDEMTRDDVEDSVGELVNIVGGSVKSLMPQPTVLSLPEVRTGGFPGAGTELCHLGGTWRDEPVSIVVLESAAAYVGVSKMGGTMGGTSR